jgi:hypothetical protein
MSSNDACLKADIEIIMRQTECYDVKQVRAVYEMMNGDVLESVCHLMKIKKQDKPVVSDQQALFQNLRDVIDDKDKMFQRQKEVYSEQQNENVTIATKKEVWLDN